MNKIKGSIILVTGGAGFVGSYVVEKLLPYEPKRIYIIDNLLRGSHENMQSFINNPVVEFLEGDIRNYGLIENIISRSDYIFHLAALRISRCAEDQEEAFVVTINATFNLVELAKKYKIKKFIYSSSASIYGLAQHFPTPETDSPFDNKTFYGAAKFFGEQLLRSYHHMHDLDYVALRYFNIYGPRMDREGVYTEVMIKWLTCIKENTPPVIFGDGSDTMDFVYVEDVADANISALLSDVTDEVFNIGTQKETSLHELLDLILKINKSKLVPDYQPKTKLTPASRRLADISKAGKLLDYSPKYSLEEGIEKLSKWFFSINE